NELLTWGHKASGLRHDSKSSWLWHNLGLSSSPGLRLGFSASFDLSPCLRLSSCLCRLSLGPGSSECLCLNLLLLLLLLYPEQLHLGADLVQRHLSRRSNRPCGRLPGKLRSQWLCHTQSTILEILWCR